MRTIAIVNQKGGCGKTTTAINLAALYAARGLRTLLVDMDPQSHCAAGLGVPESRIEYSIGNALIENLDHGFDASRLVWEVGRNLYLAPSTVMLTALEAPGGGLHQLPDRDRRLERLLGLMAGRFDRCLIDCPPTIGLLTFNAMRAAREALIPVETGFFSLRGAERQWATIQKLIAHIGRPIACHMLATLHNPESQLACNILSALRRQFAGQILPVVIHEHEVLREAASFGQPVLEYAPQSKARHDFDALADWLEEHATRPTVEIEVVSAGQTAAADAILSRQLLHGAPATAAESALLQGASTPQPPSRVIAGSRAAELARRVHDLAARHGERATIEEQPAATQLMPPMPFDPQRLATDIANAPPTLPGAAAPFVLREEADLAPVTDLTPAGAELDHLFGVRRTTRGMLFVQPALDTKNISIAGEFNFWSPTAHPMNFNQAVGVFEAIIPLNPGRYQYRIIVDGQWIADPFNDQRELNSYGEPNSVVTVT